MARPGPAEESWSERRSRSSEPRTALGSVGGGTKAGERARNPNPKEPRSPRPATMTALLRHWAARRLGGSLVQRTRAAFSTEAAAEEKRLLMERLKPRDTKDLPDVMRLIQERKEELYDLISLMEGTSEHSNYQNRQLLKFLSKQVKPRPDDSLWRRLRATERMKVVARATVVVSGITLTYLLYSMMMEEEEPDCEEARAVKAAS